MRSIIYSLYMWLRLCIILVVFRTGLKVNVMRITLQFVKQKNGTNLAWKRDT